MLWRWNPEQWNTNLRMSMNYEFSHMVGKAEWGDRKIKRVIRKYQIAERNWKVTDRMRHQEWVGIYLLKELYNPACRISTH